jgi:methionine aminopeptidase
MDPNDSDDEDYNKTFIDDPSILDKYQASSLLADKALSHVIEHAVPGADIATLCEVGDKFIDAEVSSLF